jgi:hypothetical protein
VIEFGLKLTLTPAGCPLAVRVIGEGSPPATVVVIVDVLVLFAPTSTANVEGEAAKLNG